MASAGDATANSEEIKPYKIHVSGKYLDITQQKLELTRLPRENGSHRSKDWWEPKAKVEPLVDYWLEEYSWRYEEALLNNSVPQFRTTILVPGTESSVRLHFIYSRSTLPNAVPLLLIPPFPFTNLSISHLISALSRQDDAISSQPFHVVIPSLPGLCFSDALPSNTPLISTTATLFDILMARLGHKHYVASNTGAAAGSPAGVDWKLASHLARIFSQSCLAVHFIAPPLHPPTLSQSLSAWVKWRLVRLLRRPGLGYRQDDLEALHRIQVSREGMSSADRVAGFQEPTTLSYALCDSPVGLLTWVLVMLRRLGSERNFSPREIINLAELTWLPGPEATMRFWSQCTTMAEETKKPAHKPKIGITVFTGDDRPVLEALKVSPRPYTNDYACPKWAEGQYKVISTQRLSGKPGFLAWDRPEAIVQGVRNLVDAVLKIDKRLVSEQAAAVVVKQVVVVDNNNVSGSSVQDMPTRSSIPIIEGVSSPDRVQYFTTPVQQDKVWPMTPRTPERMEEEEEEELESRDRFEDITSNTVINIGINK